MAKGSTVTAITGP